MASKNKVKILEIFSFLGCKIKKKKS